MARYLLALFILLHGLIHFMGFAKAFGYGELKNMTLPVSRPLGILWMMTAFLFLAAVACFLLKKEAWWMLGLLAIVLSQWLIICSWKDARWGTIANAIVLLSCLAAWGQFRFERAYRHDVKASLQRSLALANDQLTESDLQRLPAPVQAYIRYSGALGKPRVKNMKVIMEGEMRDKGKAYFPFVSEQYNFFNRPARLFFMKGRMYGLTVPGYHHYEEGKASMDIRLFGLIPVVRHSGPAMDKTETVTFFNDMCLMAPATLIDSRIAWETIDDHTVKAVFTNGNIRISAVLYFNERGQLVDFRSNDRTAVSEGKELPFRTPVHSWMETSGYHLIERGDAIWEYPDGEFIYGKFRVRSVAFNVYK